MAGINCGVEEEGSISPIISLYFTILMLSVFILANVSSTYVARRELINTTEAALALASQELDEVRYYYHIPITNLLNRDEERAIPINCHEATQTFRQEIAVAQLTIDVLSFECDGKAIRARVRNEHKLPFNLPILAMNKFTNEVSVAAVTRYL